MQEPIEEIKNSRKFRATYEKNNYKMINLAVSKSAEASAVDTPASTATPQEENTENSTAAFILLMKVQEILQLHQLLLLETQLFPFLNLTNRLKNGFAYMIKPFYLVAIV